jgi:hypothetical protein
MKETPTLTTHYVDGRPSETRDMTFEEIAELPKVEDETPSPDDIAIVETPEEEP